MTGSPSSSRIAGARSSSPSNSAPALSLGPLDFCSPIATPKSYQGSGYLGQMPSTGQLRFFAKHPR
jgi:hypothetical protein